MHRVPEVADAWFDSGSMPVAQWHYPFENGEMFSEQFPADFICEAIDQTRGWFYTLHAVSTLLFDQPCFKNVICLGHILAEDGSKMSKSRGNVVDPWTVFDAQGADATRWYMYTASPPGNTRRFSSNLVGEVDAEVPADAVEQLQLLRDLRQPERLRPDWRRRCRWPSARCSIAGCWPGSNGSSIGDRAPWRPTMCPARPGRSPSSWTS